MSLYISPFNAVTFEFYALLLFPDNHMADSIHFDLLCAICRPPGLKIAM